MSYRSTNISGINWRGADLTQADFAQCHAGLPRLQLAVQILGIATLAVATGVLATFTAIVTTGLLSPSNLSRFNALPGIIVIVLALTILLVAAKRGFRAVVGVSTVFLIVLAILSVFDQNSPASITLFYAPLAAIQELICLWLGSLAIVCARIHSRFVFVGLIFIALLGMVSTLVFVDQSGAQAYLDWADVVIAMSILVINIFIGCNALEPNSRFSEIVKLAINLTGFGGTSFHQSNLTEANFFHASLKHTDFRNSNLTRTYWHRAVGLEFARLENTYLSNPRVRHLLVTLNGQAQDLSRLNMEGVNLQKANLQDAKLIGANLNYSNLQNANLSRAFLKQVQLDGADLTGATLTGAYIEDWGITSTTKLDNVQCEYIYMRVPTKENPNPLRKPDNLREIFGNGDFADFIKPYVDTLDLYHSQDIDPRAISIALKDLSDNHPEDQLEFVAIERRGNSGLNLRLTTALGANKSELSHEYFSSYARIKSELPISAQLALAEQNAEIRSLRGTIEQFIQTGTRHSTIQAETIQVLQGELIVTENRGININAGGNIGDISGLVGGDVGGVVNLGTISGDVTNAIQHLPDTFSSDQPSLKDLLTQLQEVIENDTELTDPDKVDLLEQVQTLAESKQVEEPAKREGLVRKAMKIFDATLKGLPDTAKIVEACSKLLPLILKLLGLPS